MPSPDYEQNGNNLNYITDGDVVDSYSSHQMGRGEEKWLLLYKAFVNFKMKAKESCALLGLYATWCF